MIRPFLHKDLYERLHLHQSSTDYEDFFEKFIPRSHMPVEYGGEFKTIKELHEENRKLLNNMREYFVFEENQMNKKLDHHVDEYNNNNKDVEDCFYDAE